MAVGMAGLAFGGVAEKPRDFRLAFNVGDLGEVQVAPVGLALAGKSIFEIGMSFGSFQAIHRYPLLGVCVVHGRRHNRRAVQLSRRIAARLCRAARSTALPDDNYYHPARATVKLAERPRRSLRSSGLPRVIRDLGWVQNRYFMRLGLIGRQE